MENNPTPQAKKLKEQRRADKAQAIAYARLIDAKAKANKKKSK